MGVTLLTGSKAVSTMTKEQFHNEKMYQATMALARQMLRQGLITEEEYREVEAAFLKKYQPVFGEIFSNISVDFIAAQSDV